MSTRSLEKLWFSSTYFWLILIGPVLLKKFCWFCKSNALKSCCYLINFYWAVVALNWCEPIFKGIYWVFGYCCYDEDWGKYVKSEGCWGCYCCVFWYIMLFISPYIPPLDATILERSYRLLFGDSCLFMSSFFTTLETTVVGWLKEFELFYCLFFVGFVETTFPVVKLAPLNA
jgi:hypothetical protein